MYTAHFRRAYLEFGSREAAKNIVKSETPFKIGDDVIVTRMLTSDVSIEAKHAARKKRYEHLLEKKKAAESKHPNSNIIALYYVCEFFAYN